MKTCEEPSLTICEAASPPRVPAATDLGVTVWCDSTGVLGALSHVLDDEHWLHVLGVASFRLDVTRHAVEAFPCDHVDRETITDEWQSTVWPTLLQIKGAEVLHASAVSTGSGVVAFCAVSGTGKSTLAYALSQRGYWHWADDAVVLDVQPHAVHAAPLPFHTRLRSASALHFGYARDRLRRGRVRREGRDAKAALPLRAICLLAQVACLPDAQAATIERMPGAEALTGVLEHAVYFSLQDQERKRRMIQQYLGLVRQVPVFTLRFRRGLDLLPQIVQTIEEQILEGAR